MQIYLSLPPLCRTTIMPLQSLLPKPTHTHTHIVIRRMHGSDFRSTNIHIIYIIIRFVVRYMCIRKKRRLFYINLHEGYVLYKCNKTQFGNV